MGGQEDSGFSVGTLVGSVAAGILGTATTIGLLLYGTWRATTGLLRVVSGLTVPNPSFSSQSSPGAGVSSSCPTPRSRSRSRFQAMAARRRLRLERADLEAQETEVTEVTEGEESERGEDETDSPLIDI